MINKIAQLIYWIAWEATEQNTKLTLLRLVKFVYLVDLFYARETNGQTFTKLPWAFVYFGPYCQEVIKEIENAVDENLIEQNSYESKYRDKDYYLYRAAHADRPSIISELPTYVVSETRWAIKKWAEDTGGLFDYVYFQTEPMLDAVKGDILDFSNARKPVKHEEITMNRLSSKKIRAGKEILLRLRQKTLLSQEAFKRKDDRALYDKVFSDFMASMKEPDTDVGLEGTAEVQIQGNQ